MIVEPPAADGGFELPPGMTWDEWIFGPPPIEDTELEGVEVVAAGPTELEGIIVTAPPFGANLDPGDLAGIIRAFMCSQIDVTLHNQANKQDAEIGGHIERTSDGYVISNLHWGNGRGEVDIVINTLASTDDIPFYIHFHDDKPGIGSYSVSPGPSKEDLDNSRNNNIWQIVVDHEGYVFVINNSGGILLPDGTAIPYSDAIKSRTSGLTKTYPNLESQSNSWGSVDGSCHSG